MERMSMLVDMDKRALLVLGFLCATTSGFIPHLLRRDDGAEQTAQQPQDVSDGAGGHSRGDKSCRRDSIQCPPFTEMMSSMFRVNRGRMFVVNNQLRFSCRNETRDRMESCASTVRSNCAGETHWIDGLAGFYNDLCAMESVLLRDASCMNSPSVSTELSDCIDSDRGDDINHCSKVVKCVGIAFKSEQSCSQDFKTKFTKALTAFMNTAFGPNCELGF